MVNAITVLPNVTGNHEQWLRLKQNTIGSSEIGVICGLSQWSTPLELWARKTGKLAPEPENTAMWLGTKLQPIVGELFSQQTGRTIIEPNALYAHKYCEWATATPDFFVETEKSSVEVLEVKTTSARAAHFWENGQAPTLAYMQTIWQLGVLGIESGHIAALIGGQDFKHVEVEFQEPLFQQMLHLGAQFIEAVKTDTPPKATESDLKLLHELRVLEEAVVELPLELSDSVVAWHQLQQKIKTIKAELKAVESDAAKHRALIEQAMGSAANGRLGSWEVKLRKVNRNAYTVDASSYTTFKVEQRASNEFE